MASASQSTIQSRPRWPVFVALGVVLGIVLAIVWVRHEVERTRFRTQGFPDPGTITTNRPAN